MKSIFPFPQRLAAFILSSLFSLSSFSVEQPHAHLSCKDAIGQTKSISCEDIEKNLQKIIQNNIKAKIKFSKVEENDEEIIKVSSLLLELNLQQKQLDPLCLEKKDIGLNLSLGIEYASKQKGERGEIDIIYRRYGETPECPGESNYPFKGDEAPYAYAASGIDANQSIKNVFFGVQVRNLACEEKSYISHIEFFVEPSRKDQEMLKAIVEDPEKALRLYNMPIDISSTNTTPTIDPKANELQVVSTYDGDVLTPEQKFHKSKMFRPCYMDKSSSFPSMKIDPAYIKRWGDALAEIGKALERKKTVFIGESHVYKSNREFILEAVKNAKKNCDELIVLVEASELPDFLTNKIPSLNEEQVIKIERPSYFNQAQDKYFNEIEPLTNMLQLIANHFKYKHGSAEQRNAILEDAVSKAIRQYPELATKVKDVREKLRGQLNQPLDKRRLDFMINQFRASMIEFEKLTDKRNRYMAERVADIRKNNPDACILVIAGTAHLYGATTYLGFGNAGRSNQGIIPTLKEEHQMDAIFSIMFAWEEKAYEDELGGDGDVLANGGFDPAQLYNRLEVIVNLLYPSNENAIIVGLTKEDARRLNNKTSGRGTIGRHPLNNERPSGSLLAGRPGGSTKFGFTSEGLAAPSRAGISFRTSQTRAGAASRVDIASRGNDRHDEAPRSGSSRGQVSKNFNDKPLQLNTGEPFSLQTLGVDVKAITLFDLRGQQVFHSDNQQIIGLSVRPAMYIARVSYQDGATLQRKVVVR